MKLPFKSLKFACLQNHRTEGTFPCQSCEGAFNTSVKLRRFQSIYYLYLFIITASFQGSFICNCGRDDILRSIKALTPLGTGFEVLTLNGQKIVNSVPRELNTDHMKVLELAQVHCILYYYFSIPQL